MPASRSQRKRIRGGMEAFLASHPLFTVEDVMRAYGPGYRRETAKARVWNYVRTGRVMAVATRVYAAVPIGGRGSLDAVDPFAVAALLYPDGIFAYESALNLLGLARQRAGPCVVLGATATKLVNGGRIALMKHPERLKERGLERLGAVRIERGGRLMWTTGPERTLLDGFRRPEYFGGMRRFLRAAWKVQVLDLDLLRQLLVAYRQRSLWARVGWFLEARPVRQRVPKRFLRRLERECPRAPQYLIRRERGGKFLNRWNLILPDDIARRTFLGRARVG